MEPFMEPSGSERTRKTSEMDTLTRGFRQLFHQFHESHHGCEPLGERRLVGEVRRDPV
jgi:hypothetical protein